MKELPAGSENTPKPRALSIFIEFNDDGSIADYSIRCTVLKNPIRLTYDEVEHLLTSEQEEHCNPVKSFHSSSTQSPSSPYSNLTPLLAKNHSVEPIQQRRTVALNAGLLGFEHVVNYTSFDRTAILNRVTSPAITSQAIESTLTTLSKLAKRRRRYRAERGSVDFVFSEARFHIKGDTVEGSIDSSTTSMQVIPPRLHSM